MIVRHVKTMCPAVVAVLKSFDGVEWRTIVCVVVSSAGVATTIVVTFVVSALLIRCLLLLFAKIYGYFHSGSTRDPDLL